MWKLACPGDEAAAWQAHRADLDDEIGARAQFGDGVSVISDHCD